MTSWKRITLVIFVLIGGVMLFSYWSFTQFNTALGDIGATLAASALRVHSSPRAPVASTSLEIQLASTSLETPVASTSLEIQLASTSLETPVASTSKKTSR